MCEESNGVFFVCEKLVKTKVGVVRCQSIEDTRELLFISVFDIAKWNGRFNFVRDINSG